MSATLASSPATAAAVAAFHNSGLKFKRAQQSSCASTRASSGASTPLSSVSDDFHEQADNRWSVVEIDLKRRLLLAELAVVEKEQRLHTVEAANSRLEDGLLQAELARQDSKSIISALEEAVLQKDRLIAMLEESVH